MSFWRLSKFLHRIWLIKSKSSKFTSLVKGKVIKCKDLTLYLESTFKNFTDWYLIIKAADNWAKHHPNTSSTCLKALTNFVSRRIGIVETSLFTNKMPIGSKRNLTDVYLKVNRYPWIASQLHKFLWYATWTDSNRILHLKVKKIIRF